MMCARLHRFTGVGSKWAQFDQPFGHAFEMMRRGGDLYYTLRSFDVMELLSRGRLASFRRSAIMGTRG